MVQLYCNQLGVLHSYHESTIFLKVQRFCLIDFLSNIIYYIFRNLLLNRHNSFIFVFNLISEALNLIYLHMQMDVYQNVKQ